MDNTKKTYSPAEAAIEILKKVEKMYKGTGLYKTNTAHEIEAGSEPKSQNTECPEQLAAGENIKKAKKKHNEGGGEEIEGGAAEDMDEEDFDEEDLEVGSKVESEHSDDSEVSEEIAEDHLAEDEDYYEEGAESAQEELAEDTDDAKESVDDDSIDSDDNSDNIDDGSEEESEEDGEKKEKGKKIIDKVVKSEKLEKSLFPKEEKKSTNNCVVSQTTNKDYIFDEIKWKIKDMKEMEECQYIIGKEFPKHKELFSKVYDNMKSEMQSLIKKYSKVNKSEAIIAEAKDFLAKSCVDKACGLKSPKLKEFVKKRAMKKASIHDIKSGKKVADLPGDKYQPAKIKKPSERFLNDQKKFKEQRDAGRNPAKDLKDKQYRKKAAKKAVIVDKERGNKEIRRKKVAGRKVEKMLGIKENAKEAYKKPEVAKIPKINEGY